MGRKLEVLKHGFRSWQYTTEDFFKFMVMGLAFGLGFHIASWAVDLTMMRWGFGIG